MGVVLLFKPKTEGYVSVKHSPDFRERLKAEVGRLILEMEIPELCNSDMATDIESSVSLCVEQLYESASIIKANRLAEGTLPPNPVTAVIAV